MKLIKVICPSCGGDLNYSDSGYDVECTFCGSRILINDIRKNTIGNLLKMTEDAIKTMNYTEALEYANRILEIDADNVMALWAKSVCLFSQSYGNINLMNEGLYYAKKAYDLADNDNRSYIKKEIIAKLTGADSKDYSPEHTAFLLLVFETFGSEDKSLLIKINDVIIHHLKKQKVKPETEVFNQLINSFLSKLLTLDPEEYALQKYRAEEAMGIHDQIIKRKVFNFRELLFNKIFKKTVIILILMIVAICYLLLSEGTSAIVALVISASILYFLILRTYVNMKATDYKISLRKSYKDDYIKEVLNSGVTDLRL
ncbi:MAG: hypothetical protein N2510_07405 [Ignavibacteria bacterium]|nr:hypothetical protein [Ignavibacteria bacterium]